ncbi:unnamed protein product [Ixodes pacificus]
MAHLVTRVVSHKFQVCSLYKRALRNLEAWCVERDDYRIKAVELRVRFENYRHIKDMRIAKELLDKGEEELFENAHPQLYHREPFAAAWPGVVACCLRCILVYPVREWPNAGHRGNHSMRSYSETALPGHSLFH